MKKFSILCLFVCSTIYAQDNENLLFKLADKNPPMTAKQFRIYNRIINSPQYSDNLVVIFQKESLQKTPLLIPIAPMIKINLGDNAVEKGKVIWKKDADSVSLTYRDDVVFGLIYYGKNVYSINPVGNGIHVISKLDQTKLGKD